MGKLREENDFLRKENETLMTPILREKDRQIEEWLKKNEGLYRRIEELENENQNLKAEVDLLRNRCYFYFKI